MFVVWESVWGVCVVGGGGPGGRMVGGVVGGGGGGERVAGGECHRPAPCRDGCERSGGAGDRGRQAWLV